MTEQELLDKTLTLLRSPDPRPYACWKGADEDRRVLVLGFGAGPLLVLYPYAEPENQFTYALVSALPSTRYESYPLSVVIAASAVADRLNEYLQAVVSKPEE